MTLHASQNQALKMQITVFSYINTYFYLKHIIYIYIYFVVPLHSSASLTPKEKDLGIIICSLILFCIFCVNHSF